MWLGLARYLFAERRSLRRRAAQAEAALDLERARNRQREDELISRLLTANGSYGIPARKPEVKAQAPEAVTHPLSALEEARLVEYRKAAVAAGKTEADGESYFWQERGNGQREVFTPPRAIG